MYQKAVQPMLAGTVQSSVFHLQALPFFRRLIRQPSGFAGVTTASRARQSRAVLATFRFMALLVLCTLGFQAQAVPVTAFEPTHFTRQSGTPVTERRTFNTLHLNGSFVLTVYNGGLEDDAAQGELVSSSTVTLNGVTVIGPQNFDQDATVVTVPVSLTSANELTVELRGKPGGVITVEITGTVNNAPFADAGINQTVNVGDTVTLDGTASTDEDGDALTYQWTLVAKPDGSQAALNPSNSASPSFVADEPGHYVAGLVVNDGQLDGGPSQVTVTALAPNDAPVLDPIGNRTVPVGTKLTLDLSASDPDGDELSYSVQELPLPDEAYLDGYSGQFTFTPDPEHVGTIDLTFTVSDGALSDQETVTLTIPAIDGTASTRFSGRLLDANDYANGITTPIVGATVSFLNNGPAAVSDAQGYFSLDNLTAGTQVLDIDPSGAQDSPAGGPYGGFREQYLLYEHVDNLQERPFFLPRIDLDSVTQVDPALETVVTNSSLGVTIVVPPHTAKNPDGSDYSGPLSISLVPPGFAPATMPKELGFGQVVTIQPVGLTFATPVPITFANSGNLEPGNEVDLWSIDPEMGVFVEVGTGQVSADGLTIETIEGGLRATDWHSRLTPGLDGENNGEPPTCKSCDKDTESTSSRLATASGDLSTDFSLPGYVSQGQDRGLSFVYESRRAHPVSLIPFEITINQRSAVPEVISHQAVVGGVTQNNLTYLSTEGLKESRNETIRAVSRIDSSELETGTYPYTVEVTNHFIDSSRTAFLDDQLVVVNEQDSPFGAGWGLAGLTRLVEGSDGRVLIYDGNGSRYVYDRIRVNLGLDQWRQEGKPNGGNWTVAEDGLSVFQRINGRPTFFVSPDDYLNTTLRGRFRVAARGDDDYIGLVFGYQSPLAANGDAEDDYEFILFDWKKRAQSTAQQGFTLSRIRGSEADFWAHSESADLEVLATDYGSRRGWRPQRNYEYEVDYDSDRIAIRINGNTIFDVAGSFPAGKFGFYNYSQPSVRYAHYLTADTADFESAPGDYSTLRANTDGSFTRTLKDGTQFHYNAEGLQTAVVDRNGNTTSYTYNAAQQLTAITDPVGKTTTFNYINNRLDSVTDPAGRVTRFEFDPDNNLIKVVFPDGRFKRFGYDDRHLMTTEADERGFTGVREYHSYGRIERVTRADGSVHRASYEQTVGLVDPAGGFGTEANPGPVVRPEEAISSFTDGENHTQYTRTDRFGRLIERTDANGLVTRIERDDDGNPLKTIRPDLSEITRIFDEAGNLTSETESYNGAVTAYSYDPVFNRITSITDARQNTTTYTRDPGTGNLQKISNALGHETLIQTNGAGQITQITDANGLVTDYGYNAQGLPVTITETPPAGGGVTRTATIAYNSAGQVQTVTTPDSIVLTLDYDARGRLESVTDHTGQRIEYDYDAAGNRTRTTTLEDDGTLASTAAQSFDALSRLERIVQPHISGLDSIQRYGYDGDGNLIAQTDPNDHTATQEYDPGNRLDRRIDALLGTTLYDYDDNGYLTQVIAPNNAQTDYVVDPLGRITQETSPDRGVISYTYDLNNNLKTRTDARGVTVEYDYDALNRLTEIRYPDSQENVTLTYDTCLFGIGRLCTVSDQSGLTQLQYDAYGNVTGLSESRDGVTYSQSYQYGAGHRIVSMTLPSGRPVAYQRDSLGRIETITADVDGSHQTILDQIGYNADGRVVQRTYGNGLAETRFHDLQGRLLSQTLGSADQTALSYDANSNVLSRNTATDSHSYQYDPLDRLQQELDNGFNLEYHYDGNGNRTLKVQGNPSIPDIAYGYTPNSNRLDTIDSAALQYDNAGNLTQDVQGRQYVYNGAGRLIEISQNGQTLAQYRYNRNGQRTRKISGPDTIHYHYDLAGNLIGETQGDGTPIRDYIRHENQTVAQIDHDPTGPTETIAYLHSDHLGTPRLATDSTQAIVWRWEGEAFGNTPPQNLGTTVNLRFPGQYYDQESELHYNYFRYYDPQTGRYITSDPIGIIGGWSTYAYVGGNPLYWIDPYGLTEKLPITPAQIFFELLTHSEPVGPGSDIVPLNCPGSDKQFGKKFGEHRDPSRPGYRNHQEYRQLANDILNDLDSSVTQFPDDASQYPAEIHIERGNDLLRLDPNGNFRSLYPVK